MACGCPDPNAQSKLKTSVGLTRFFIGFLPVFAAGQIIAACAPFWGGLWLAYSASAFGLALLSGAITRAMNINVPIQGNCPCCGEELFARSNHPSFLCRSCMNRVYRNGKYFRTKAPEEITAQTPNTAANSPANCHEEI